MVALQTFQTGIELFLEEKPSKTVYTIGYEGKTVKEFVDELVRRGISRVVDVRSSPVSRKRGFSKTPLMKELMLARIDYISMPALGAPRELRRELRSGTLSLEEFFDLYREHLKKNHDALRELRSYVSTRTSAVMCYEADWRQCHRSVIAEFLERDGFRVVHL